MQAAAISHNRCRAFHDGLPIGIRHVRNENVARLDTIHFFDITNDLGRANADFLADTTPHNNHIRSIFEGEALNNPTTAALHRLGTRLQARARPDRALR